MENELTYIKPWENTRKYNFKHIIEVKENGVSKKSEVSFNLMISCLPTMNANSLCWKIERENFLLNGELPETPHMQMFIGAENSLFPLTVEISDEGIFLGIYDFVEWKNKAIQRLEKLKSQFEGHYAEDFIQRFQDEIETATLLKKKLLGQTVFTILFNNFFKKESSQKINWNLLKIGSYAFQGKLNHIKIEDKLKEITFTNIDSEIILNQPERDSEAFHSDFQFVHQFNPFTGQTHQKECKVLLESKIRQFFYQEKIKLQFQGLRIEKSIPIKESRQKQSFFLSEKEEIKDI